ncbi:peptidoglycan-binding protein [Anabaena sp. UHCC 0204]|jgi:murein L,D-transpeptidase YcbB/YkuD|uniref:peptidoglycan-binding domain-containing protein n=1 Tax=Anabaena sp. UHCC 0204 TaxID=2590009 RepID=UPI001445F094|nr:peptidoglycan-binding domain-containing protein [Anabaena sp. UHCC 0204]MTJ06653.1 peptidoglycan-binding protein [Anabaena sp. UHCC 0204]
MEYLAYSYMYIEDEEKNGNFELDIPKLQFNWRKLFKSSAWLTLAGVTILLATVAQMQFASAEYARTNGSCLYIRRGPSTANSSVACVRNGSYIGETGSVRHGFARISSGRYRGYYVAERWISNSPGSSYRRHRSGYGVGGRVTVGYGARGERVRQIQRALGIRVDGVYGSRTINAVRHFQRRNGLRVDGAVGPQTRRALGI